MLKTIRIIIALISIIAITLLFVDFTGTAQELWPWMAKIQFLPAILSGNIAIIIFLIFLTLIFGRIYCSIICPLGILQDIASRIHTITMGKKGKYRFGFKTPSTQLRISVLAIFTILLILGLTTILFSSIAGLIEPYSAYGRIASQIFAPIYDFINNILAQWSEKAVDDYTFYRVAYSISIPLLAIAIATLLIISIMAWRGGRDYCNKICPIGTVLGYISRFSLLKIDIDTDKCRGCGLCARSCKAKCIDAKNHEVDYSRCVACMNCLDTCRDNAIKYTWRRHAPKIATPQIANANMVVNEETTDSSRRNFIITSSLLMGSLIANSAIKTDGGLTRLKAKESPLRLTPILPAGAQSLKHLTQHCTGCQLCVQSCPQKVLKPRLSLKNFMQPALDFTDGYCEPSCTKCSEICPVGAFHQINEAEKSSIKIGTAVVDVSICLSVTKGVNCGSCASHCPTGAIEMIEIGNGNMRPIINESICIGCGACEYHCPVGTLASMSSRTSAIHVEGIEVHQEI